jgi:sugar lactone lactonase YvrE
MKTKLTSGIIIAHRSLGGVASAVLMFTAFSVQAQNLFVATLNGNVISEYTPSGVPSTFAYNLDGPYALAFNQSGDLYEADFYSGSVYEFTPNGVRSTIVSGGTAPGGIGQPTGLAIDTAGDIFVACGGINNSIYEFTPGGVQSTFASGLLGPQGLAFNSAGDLFEADGGTGNIYEFTPGGVKTTYATLNHPDFLAFDSKDNLFVSTAYFGNGIVEITPAGTQSTFASGMKNPAGLAFNSDEDLFVADANSGYIYEFTTDGQRSTFASVSGFGLAFQGVTLPVPEPSVWGLLLLGGGLLAYVSTRVGERRNIGGAVDDLGNFLFGQLATELGFLTFHGHVPLL